MEINSKPTKLDELESTKFIKNIKTKMSASKDTQKEEPQKIKDKNLPDDLKKMRDKLTNLSPSEIIDDILKTHRSNHPKNIHNSLDYIQTYLENLKRNEINNYIESIKEKSIKEIIKDFESRLDNYNSNTKLFALEKEKESKEYQSQMNLMKSKKLELESKLGESERENKDLSKKLKESEEMIHKLQTKFVIFEKIKPTLDEFFKEYPYQSPSEILKDIKEKRQASIKILEDLNEMREKLFKTEKDKKEVCDINKKTIDDLSMKIFEIESKHKNEVEKYIYEIYYLNEEMESLKVSKEENIKLHNMLYSLYNKLIERLSLDKNIKIDPKFILSEKDFQPRMFDNEEIAQYISMMLNNSDESKSSKMFRETTAYANMMLRISQKEVKSRFDPLSTFKEIKMQLEKAKDEKNQYKQDLNILKDKINNYEAEIKKLKNELKYKNLQYENLEEKFNKKFQDRLERKKEIKNIEILKRRESRLVSARNFRTAMNIKETESLVNDELGLANYDKNHILTKHRTQSAYVKDKSNNPTETFFITNSKNSPILKKADANEIKISQRNNSSYGFYKDTKSNKEINILETKSVVIRPSTTRWEFLRPKSSSNLFKYSNHSKGKNDKIRKNIPQCYTDNSQGSTEMRKTGSSLIIKPDVKIKKLKISKNRDKLIKEDICINESGKALHSLIEHTNKLFLYRARMKGVELGESSSNNKANIFAKFKKNLDKNFAKLNKLNGIHNDQPKKTTGLGDRIIDNIDIMIKSLEK